MVIIEAFFILLQHLILRTMGYHNHIHYSLLTDKAVLLAFKSTITFDLNATLANWEEAVDVCNFTGVTCNKLHHRVARLELPGCGLIGPLSPVVSNLTALRVLMLYGNQFFGVIPSEFSHLRRLSRLHLEGNNLHGPIPESFAFFSELRVVSLSDNNLTGTLPPSFFYNCTSLAYIDLSHNFFTGKIPKEIGNSPDLWCLTFFNNQFTGQLPASLVNTSLYILDVGSNYLSGKFPSEIVGKMPSLTYLYLSYNNMISHDHNTNLQPFFTALENCTDLVGLELAGMDLGGTLPNFHQLS